MVSHSVSQDPDAASVEFEPTDPNAPDQPATSLATDANRATYEAHATELTNFATALVGPSDAGDVVSIAVVSAFSSPSWPSVLNRRAYLYRAVVNAANSYKRSSGRRSLREQMVASRSARTTHQPEFRPDVLAAVEDLSPQQRAVVYLTYWEDLTNEAVAERLDVSVGTVKRHLDRARQNLRRKLDV